NLLVDDDLCRAQHALILAFSQNEGFAAPLCHREDRLHRIAGVVDETTELLTIGVHIDDRTSRDSRIGRGPGHRRRDYLDQTRVERFWDEVVAAKAKTLALVRGRNDLGYLRHREIRERADGGEFHLLVDGRRPAVERAPEDEWEAQDIVDLIGI